MMEKKKKKKVKKCKNEETKLKTKCACVYILPTQPRAMTCYKTDSSSRQGGRPMAYKTAAALTTAKIWS
jgi:hypothetical protein